MIAAHYPLPTLSHTSHPSIFTPPFGCGLTIGALSRSRLSRLDALKYLRHSLGASIVSPPCLVMRWRTEDPPGVLTATPETITWPLVSAGNSSSNRRPAPSTDEAMVC